MFGSFSAVSEISAQIISCLFAINRLSNLNKDNNRCLERDSEPRLSFYLKCCCVSL